MATQVCARDGVGASGSILGMLRKIRRASVLAKSVEHETHS